MKILFLIGSLSNSGGMERMLTFQANYFADHFEYDVTVLTYDQKNSQDFFTLSDKVNRIRIPVEKKSHPNRFFNLYLLKKYLESLKSEIEKTLLQSHFDICLSFGIEGKFLYQIKDKSKKIIEFHFSKDFYKQDSGSFLQKVWRRYRFKQSIGKTKMYDRMVVLTETDKDFWQQYLSNVVAINNPNVMQSEANSSLENKVAVSLGRLTRQKGFDRLIDIWEKVAEKYPDWELHIYGEGAEKKKLMELISDKNLQEFVQINPPVKDVAKVYQSASLYLMASRFEGFGLVLIEAMSFGLPVIAYNVIGPNELVQNNVNGFLIEDGNSDEFAYQIGLLCSDYEKRKELGENAKEFVEKFSPQQIMKQWSDLFNDVLRR